MLIAVPVNDCIPAVTPMHGVIAGGGGTVSIGLTPPELISVEPKGIPVGRTVVRVVPSDGTAPAEKTPPEIADVAAVVQPELIAPDMPPGADMVEPLVVLPAVPMVAPVVIPLKVVSQLPGSGLKPPGIISVAPMGIPVPR
jgi:hypothetical protein